MKAKRITKGAMKDALIKELKLALRVARQLNRDGFGIVKGSPFDKVIGKLLRRKITANKTR